MVARLEPRIRASAKDILDQVAKKGSADFVTSIAAELPLQVIAELLGVPQTTATRSSSGRTASSASTIRSFRLRSKTARPPPPSSGCTRTSSPTRAADEAGKICHVLINAEIEGERLSDMEFDSFFLLLAVAGNETTRNLISGGLLALIEHPEQSAPADWRPDADPERASKRCFAG